MGDVIDCDTVWILEGFEKDGFDSYSQGLIGGMNYEGRQIDADDSDDPDGCEGLDGLEFDSREGETWKKGCAIWHKHKSMLRCTRP